MTRFDPFLGSGQTAKVALALGRNCVGYDVEKSYVSLAERKTYLAILELI